MLTIDKAQSGETLTVSLAGRLDTTTAKQFHSEVNDHLEGITNLVLDCKDLEYISSAGLREFLGACKTVSESGSHVIKNCNDNVLGVFKITKLGSLLNIE